jgi:2-oxoisovalerate dehydrogenase E1 component beta subunit
MIDAPVGDRSSWEPRWPDTPDLFLPIGPLRLVRPGRDATVVTYGRHVPVARRVADDLAAEGLDIEVIDLRTLHPYDWDGLKASVRRTRRVLFVNEDTEITNFGEHLLRRTVEELFDELLAAPRLLAGKHLPGIGLADNLERASVPQREDMEVLLRAMCSETRGPSGPRAAPALRISRGDTDASEALALAYARR